jgi:hypothetical protein
MDWLLNHPQALVAVAIVVVAILQKFKQARTQETAGEAPAGDGQEAERTRRIQEEIRRRIMERRGLMPAPPAAPDSVEEAPEFPEPPPMFEEVRPVMVEPPLQAMDAAAAPGYSGELERQQQMFAQLRELETARPAHARIAPATVEAPVAAPANRLPADLRTPAGLRRAVVLREILGPPVGMR